MPRPQEQLNTGEKIKQALAEGLRNKARNPDITRYQPHDKQLPFHRSEAPGRLFIGGNRSGKTVGGAAETVFYARGEHPYKKLRWEPPLRLRVVTVDIVQGLEKIVLPEVKKWLPPSSLINGSWEDSYSKALRTLTLDNMSFIEFLTYEMLLEKFAGTSRHGIWFDEEPPKDIFTECKLRLTDTEGDWWITMTPVEGMTWTYNELYEPNNPLIDIIEVDMDENPHLSERGKEIALSGLSNDEIDARKHGQYVSIGGLIYSEFDDKINLIDPIAWEDLPFDGVLHMNSMDHGFTNATCWLWAYADTSGNLVVYDEYYVEKEIVQTHAKNVLDRDKKHSEGRTHPIPPVYSVGDPSIRNTQPSTGISIQNEYAENGIVIVLGNNDVKYGIDRIKKLLLNRKLFITRNCVKLIWELKRYRWATWRHTNDRFDKNKKEEPNKKDDHACDALRYLVASRPEAEDGVTVPKRNVLNAPASIDADNFIDTDISVNRERNAFDEYLGADF